MISRRESTSSSFGLDLRVRPMSAISTRPLSLDSADWQAMALRPRDRRGEDGNVAEAVVTSPPPSLSGPSADLPPATIQQRSCFVTEDWV